MKGGIEIMAEKKLLTKDNLVSELAEHGRMSKIDAQKAIDIVFTTIAKGLVDGTYDGVRIAGFGTFEVVERKERVGVNPANANTKITIPASRAVKFKASNTLKEIVKNS